ncbi:MAG TPA: hypothetical protein VIE38_04315 [Gaiellaceae bacterium]|jgi:hypothetical protein
MRTVLAVAAAIGSLPHAGTLVPGRSLGGVHLGEAAVQVRAALGVPGVCDGCGTTTWYFTYRKFTNPGLAVELKAGRVTGVYTVWQPGGWHTPAGLRLGAFEGQVTSLASPVTPTQCPGYTALVRDARAVRTAYYIVDGKLWGFGLMTTRSSPCR